MSVNFEEYQATVRALAAINMASLNAISALLIRLTDRGVLISEDIDVIESASRTPLDMEIVAGSLAIAELLTQHDTVFAELRNRLSL